jgi:hypothetical protein
MIKHLLRYISWAIFVAAAFFAISAHTYSAFNGWEAVGAAVYGGLIGVGIAAATMKNVPVGFCMRLLIALAWIVGCALLYLRIFANEVGNYSSRREILITGVVLASFPACLWLVRQRKPVGDHPK